MEYKTDQEKYWAGPAGDEYIIRNADPAILAANIAFFAKALSRTHGIESVLEFGANIGLNLIAISRLMPLVDIDAVEINSAAVDELEALRVVDDVAKGSILDYEIYKIYDLVLSKGLLIHIAPDQIWLAYDKIYNASRKYILLAEYYNPVPVEIEYRGQHDRLFKRDFAGEITDIHPDLELIDYGFIYHRDPNFKQDDMTWFLMEKK